MKKLIKKIKLLKLYITLKKKGYNKEKRYFIYATQGLLTFEEYENFIDNYIMKNEHIPRID